MKKMGWISLAVAALDQVIKSYVRTVSYGEVFFEIPGFVALMHCSNTGAAFSLLSGKTLFLAVLSAALLGGIAVFAFRKMGLTVYARIAFACMIGGGIGNLLDRVFVGGVTDYIRLLVIDFPVFNLADIAITCSVIVLLLLLFTDTLEVPSEEKYGSDH